LIASALAPSLFVNRERAFAGGGRDQMPVGASDEVAALGFD